MSRISFKNIVNQHMSPIERRHWIAYRFRNREFEQRKHGNSAYDTDVDYVVDDYYEPENYDTL